MDLSAFLCVAMVLVGRILWDYWNNDIWWY